MTTQSQDVSLRWWQRFHVRLTAFHGAIVFIVLAAMSLVFYELHYAAELEGLRGRLKATVTTLARQLDGDTYARLPLTGAPDSAEVRALFDLFRGVANDDPDISSIYALRRTEEPGVLRFVADYAANGEHARPGERYDASAVPRLVEGTERVVVESHLFRDKWGLSLSGYAPLRARGGASLGVIGVDVMADRIEAIKAQVLTMSLLVFGVALALLSGLAIFTGYRIRGPLARINAAAKRIAQGDFEAEVALDRRDEFGVMGAHLDAISRSLKERDFIRDIFGRYVSADVARRLLSDRSAQALGDEEREATILFSDLEGYTTMNEQVPPKAMLGVLNTYLGAMTEIIERHQGVIIEFLGDAILCVFNTPNDVDAHAGAAVRCALEMRARLDALNEEWARTPVAESWRASGFERLRMRVGVHTGVVVAGNIGSRTRMKYGVLGDVVNLAARIEHMNKDFGTSILLTRTVHDRLPDDLAAQAAPRGERQIRGRQGRVEVFSL